MPFRKLHESAKVILRGTLEFQFALGSGRRHYLKTESNCRPYLQVLICYDSKHLQFRIFDDVLSKLACIYIRVVRDFLGVYLALIRSCEASI